MTYTYQITQDERGPVARIYSDGAEVNYFGPFEDGRDSEAEAWALAMVAALTDGSVVLQESPE